MSAIAQKMGAADGGSQQEPLGEGGCLGQLNAFLSKQTNSGIFVII